MNIEIQKVLQSGMQGEEEQVASKLWSMWPACKDGRNILKADEYFNWGLVKDFNTFGGNKSSVWWNANIDAELSIKYVWDKTDCHADHPTNKIEWKFERISTEIREFSLWNTGFSFLDTLLQLGL